MPGIQIIGPGNNVGAQVNNEGRLRTHSISLQPKYHVNIEHALAFNAYYEVEIFSSPTTFLYLKNLDDKPLVIENMFLFDSTSDAIVSLYTNPSGSPSNGTNITPVNSNLGSNVQANGVFQYGSDITGLSTGTLYGKLPVLASTPTQYSFKNWIVMPRNSSLRLEIENGSNLISNLTFFYLIES